MFTVTQYDSYSYLFTNPTFISLDPSATVPANISIKGMRLGVNGRSTRPAQSYATMNATVSSSSYTAANGQLLSNLGTIAPLTLGPDNDLFFLAFDQFGSSMHPFVEPVITPGTPVPTTVAQPDLGVATFERMNNSLSRITGVPITNGTVQAIYLSGQQSLPSQPLIAAFLPSHQTAIRSWPSPTAARCWVTRHSATRSSARDWIRACTRRPHVLRLERQRQPRHRHQRAGQQRRVQQSGDHQGVDRRRRRP